MIRRGHGVPINRIVICIVKHQSARRGRFVADRHFSLLRSNRRQGSAVIASRIRRHVDK